MGHLTMFGKFFFYYSHRKSQEITGNLWFSVTAWDIGEVNFDTLTLIEILPIVLLILKFLEEVLSFDTLAC